MTTPDRRKVAVVDDDQFHVWGLRHTLAGDPGLEVVPMDFHEALAREDRFWDDVDVLVTDAHDLSWAEYDKYLGVRVTAVARGTDRHHRRHRMLRYASRQPAHSRPENLTIIMISASAGSSALGQAFKQVRGDLLFGWEDLKRKGVDLRHLVRHPEDYLEDFGAGLRVDQQALRRLGVTPTTQLHSFVRDSETLHSSLVARSLLHSKSAAVEAQKAVRAARETLRARYPGIELGRAPQQQVEKLDLLRGSHPYSADPDLYLRARGQGHDEPEQPGPW